MSDTRLFRITNHRGEHRVVNRKTLGSILGYVKGNHGRGDWKHGTPKVIHATNAEATEGWTDVTEEFLGSGT